MIKWIHILIFFVALTSNAQGVLIKYDPPRWITLDTVIVEQHVIIKETEYSLDDFSWEDCPDCIISYNGHRTIAIEMGWIPFDTILISKKELIKRRIYFKELRFIKK